MIPSLIKIVPSSTFPFPSLPFPPISNFSFVTRIHSNLIFNGFGEIDNWGLIVRPTRGADVLSTQTGVWGWVTEWKGGLTRRVRRGRRTCPAPSVAISLRTSRSMFRLVRVLLLDLERPWCHQDLPNPLCRFRLRQCLLLGPGRLSTPLRLGPNPVPDRSPYQETRAAPQLLE